MKKNKLTRELIIKRLTVAVTAAVFVLGTSLFPVNSFAFEDGTAGADITKGAPDVTVETEADKDMPERGTGFHEIKEVKDWLTVDKKDQPEYFKKKMKRLSRDIPSRYDPREMDFFKNRVDVLDQNPTDTCWAHSICTVAQASYLKELYDSGKTITKDYDMSPLDFAYNFYNRKTYEPFSLYGYTSKDFNKARTNAMDNGGNSYLSVQALANWMGTYAENDYSKYLDTFDHDILLENSMFLPDDGYDDYGTIMNPVLVKEAIMDHGAVAADIFYDDYFEGLGGKTYFCDYNYDSNHAIAIVGWDDNYSKNDFHTPSTPEMDGAWIVQNSWGTEANDGGYVYVSYDDWTMGGAVALDMQPADAYDCNYHYDGNAAPALFKRKVGQEAANVYTVPDDGNRHTIKAVGLTTWNDFRADYNIKIYRKVAKTPTSGKLAAEFNVSSEYPGTYTFDLADKGESPVNLNTGEKFAIVIKATDVDPYDGKFYIGYESKGSFGWVSFKSTAKKKECYYRDKSSGKWKDLYSKDKTGSFRIKAFTDTTPRISLESASVSVYDEDNAYTGKAIKPEPKVMLGSKTLVKDVDYTVSYSNNKNPGTGTVKVTGIGLYKGTAGCKFYIGTITGLHLEEQGDTYLKLAWDKQAKVTGYKIYKVTESGDKLVKTIKKPGTVTFTDKNLEPNTRYQYRVKAYKKIKKKTYTGPEKNIVAYTSW